MRCPYPDAFEPSTHPANKYVPAAVRNCEIACSRKSLICIRPVVRLVGRGLIGVAHARWSHYRQGLELPFWPSDSGHVFVPFHAFRVPRTPFGYARSDTDCNRVSWYIKSRFVPQNTPGHPCQLIGQSDGQLVSDQAFRSLRQPGTKAEIGPFVAPHQDHFCSLHK